MKKIIALLLAACLVFALCACGSSAPKKFTVGVCQLVQHPALDSATQGFIDALKEELGDAVEIDNQNASGRLQLQQLTAFQCWAPQSPSTVWHLISRTLTAPSAVTCPAHPTLHLSINRHR